MEERRESIRAEEALRRNMEAFRKSAEVLESGLRHFDESMERNLENIDSELAAAVERLGRMTELVMHEHEKMKREFLSIVSKKGESESGGS
jgi:type I site-specific restriction endonuclease